MSKVVHKEVWTKTKVIGWAINLEAPCGFAVMLSGKGSRYNSKVTCKRCLKKLSKEKETK